MNDKNIKKFLAMSEEELYQWLCDNRAKQKLGEEMNKENIKKANKLLEKARSLTVHFHDHEHSLDKEDTAKIDRYIYDIQNLLKPEQCQKCRGDKAVPIGSVLSGLDTLTDGEIPCPDCQSQEPDAENPISPELTDEDVMRMFPSPDDNPPLKHWRRWGEDMCFRLRAANKRAEKAEQALKE
jgi:hypothetical protein